jgi:transposase
MGRRSFSREFKLEAIKLVRERGVAVAQASRDLEVHENVLRKWIRDWEADPQQAVSVNRYVNYSLSASRSPENCQRAEGGKKLR